MKTGIQIELKRLDSPVSSTGQADQVRNDKMCKVISGMVDLGFYLPFSVGTVGDKIRG